MNRRQLLHRLAMLLGGALSAPVAAAVASGDTSSGSRPSRGPRTLSAEQDRLVTTLAELILPTTDTPGAAAAGVNEFIDLMLSKWLTAAERERFLAGLADLEARSRDLFDRGFLELTADEQMGLLEPLDVAAAEARRAADLERPTDLPFFGMLKEMTLVGYYTSEIGMKQELRYEENPGSYDGCVPLAEIGRSWA